MLNRRKKQIINFFVVENTRKQTRKKQNIDIWQLKYRRKERTKGICEIVSYILMGWQKDADKISKKCQLGFPLSPHFLSFLFHIFRIYLTSGNPIKMHLEPCSHKIIHFNLKEMSISKLILILISLAVLSSPKCQSLNGILEPGQDCDTNNMTNSGCFANCTKSQQFHCIQSLGTSSKCYKCGNGIIQGDQVCDLGSNLNASNPHSKGCADNCLSSDEQYLCIEGVCQLCGGSTLNAGEECDDGNRVDGDGCSSECKIQKNIDCGNGIREFLKDEECDDGNNENNDGCNKECKIQPEWECSETNGKSQCLLLEQEINIQKLQSKIIQDPKPISVCGNAVLQKTGQENCDDGNEEDGDGCTSTCQVEDGWKCHSIPSSRSYCVKDNECGDGVLNKIEECDDGNYFGGDGCSPNCRVEEGWSCNAFGCVRRCGNGVVDTFASEHCDDGNTVDNDGCGKDCQIQKGYECFILFNGKSVCEKLTHCGNAEYQPNYGEECDDGNDQEDDGCSNNCKLSENSICINVPGYKTVCGGHSFFCPTRHVVPQIVLPQEAREALKGTEVEGAETVAEAINKMIYFDSERKARIKVELEHEVGKRLQECCMGTWENIFYNLHFCVGYF